MKKFRILILLFFIFSSFLYGVTFSAPKSDICYIKRVIPEKYDVVFNTMKTYLMSSNFLIKNGDKDSKFLYSEGMIVINNDHYEIKFSVNFKSKYEGTEELTVVTVVANYELVEEVNKVSALSLGTISFPISTPWSKEFRKKASDNIKDPLFYQGFYYGFYRALYEEEIDDYGTQKQDQEVKSSELKQENKIIKVINIIKVNENKSSNKEEEKKEKSTTKSSENSEKKVKNSEKKEETKKSEEKTNIVSPTKVEIKNSEEK